MAKAKENKHLSIFEQKKYLEKRAGEANQINAFAENLLANGNEVEILTFVGTLQRRFDFCQKSKTSIDPKIPDAFRFLPEIRAPATQAQHNIPMYGIIATQLPDPQCCVLEIEEEIILRVHRRAELRMISKDSDGRPLCHGGIILLVQARYKDATAKEILPTQISDKRDGTYLIAFTPDAVGVIYLSIRIQDKDIKVEWGAESKVRSIDGGNWIVFVSINREVHTKYVFVRCVHIQASIIAVRSAQAKDRRRWFVHATVKWRAATVDAAMVTKVIREDDIGHAVQMYSKHPNARPRIHFVCRMEWKFY